MPSGDTQTDWYRASRTGASSIGCPRARPAWQTLTTPWKVAPPKQFYHAPGCLECRNTGFYGRQGIYEILPVEGKIQSAIVDNMELDQLRLTAMKSGMRTLRLGGAQKVARGETTIAEVLRVAPPVHSQ